MAAIDVQNILSNLRLAQERRAQTASASLEQQRLNNLRDFQQSEVQARHDELDRQQKEFEANHAIALAESRAKLLSDKRTVEQQAADRLTAGLPVPGAQRIGSGVMAPGTMMNQVPSQDEQGNPTTTSLITPTPQAQAQSQSDLQNIKDQPKIAMAAAAQQAETQRQIAVAQEQAKAQKAIAYIHESGENARNERTIGGEKDRALLNLGYGLPANTDPTTGASVHAHVIQGLMNGTITEDDLPHYVQGKGAQAKILQDLADQGYKPLNKDQAKMLGQAIPLASKLPDYLAALETQRSMGNSLGQSLLGPLQNSYAFNKDYATNAKNLTDTTAAFAKMFAGTSRGANMSEIKLQQGYNLDPSKLPEDNAKAAGTLFNDYYDGIDNGILSGLSPEQKALIHQAHGLDKFVGMGDALKAGHIPTPGQVGYVIPQGNQSPIPSAQAPATPNTGMGGTGAGIPNILNITPVQ